LAIVTPSEAYFDIRIAFYNVESSNNNNQDNFKLEVSQ